MKRIYLDYNATTPVEPSVLEAMLPYFSGEFGNASSIHTFGQRARAGVETAREQVAALLNARAQEIVSPAAARNRTITHFRGGCRGLAFPHFYRASPAHHYLADRARSGAEHLPVRSKSKASRSAIFPWTAQA